MHEQIKIELDKIYHSEYVVNFKCLVYSVPYFVVNMILTMANLYVNFIKFSSV